MMNNKEAFFLNLNPSDFMDLTARLNKLEKMIRIGSVSSIDTAKLMARVIYKDEYGTVSQWLRVVQCFNNVVVHEADSHTHDVNVLSWMPKINDLVISIHPFGGKGDGFILGCF